MAAMLMYGVECDKQFAHEMEGLSWNDHIVEAFPIRNGRAYVVGFVLCRVDDDWKVVERDLAKQTFNMHGWFEIYGTGLECPFPKFVLVDSSTGRAST